MYRQRRTSEDERVMSAVVPMVVAGCGLIAALAAFSRYIAHRVERMLPAHGRFVDIGADRIHYVEYGSGPAIVFIHGLGGQMRNFAYLELERLARSHRVILVDRPGAGHSIRGPRSPANLFAQARTIAALIEALGLGKPMLVGHSLGGAIALAVALNHPQSVSRLALIAPLTHVEASPPGPFRALMIRSPLLRRAISLTLSTPMAIIGGRAALGIVFSPEPVPRNFPIDGGGLLALRPRSFYASSSDMIAIPEDLSEMERRYATLRMPVDVLYGREDRILNWQRQGESLTKKLACARLRVVEGGHMLPVTQPAATTEWISQVAGSARESVSPARRV
jgi:pimeloyl-ACP methyl ester carboxylesterase